MVLALVTVPPLINSSPTLDALADTVTLPELVKVPSLPNSISKKTLLPDVAPAKTLPLTALVMLLPPMTTVDLAEHRRLRRDCFAIDDAAAEDIQEGYATRVR